MSHTPTDSLILAFYPSSRGFGYVLFEGPLTPYDWGIKEVRGRNRNGRVLRLLEDIINNYAPTILVVEDFTDDLCHRTDRIAALYRSVMRLADANAITVVRYSMQSVKSCFAASSAFTKHDIAVAISKIIPALSYQVPPERKIWMSEDSRQALYDAASLGLTHFYTDGALRS